MSGFDIINASNASVIQQDFFILMQDCSTILVLVLVVLVLLFLVAQSHSKSLSVHLFRQYRLISRGSFFFHVPLSPCAEDARLTMT